MKSKIIKIILVHFLFSTALDAKLNDKTILAVGSVILGSIIANSSDNSENYEVTDYKNYKLNQEYTITASQNLIHIKEKVGVEYKYKLIRPIPIDDDYTLEINNIISKQKFMSEIHIANSRLTRLDEISGKIPLKYTAKFDANGKLEKSDYPLFDKEDIGKQYFVKGVQFQNNYI